MDSDPSAAPVEWQLLVEHVSVALSVHDMDGTFRYASPAFRDLLGIDPEQVVGRNVYEMFHEDDLEDARNAHARAVVGGFSMRQRLRRDDGTYCWAEVVVEGVPEHDVLVAAMRPLTARRSLEQSLEQQRAVNAQLASLREQRTEFLTAVAHRARHPVTFVNGTVELLTAALDSDDDQRALALMRQLVPRLQANVSELVDLVEQVTDSDLLLRRVARRDIRPADLHRLATEVVAELAGPEAPVTVEIEPWHTVMVDADQMRRALRALLHNAIAHTPSGTPVWVSAEDTSDETVVTVSDAGPGVADHDKRTIFEAFRRGDGTDHDPGMGLGLHTVAEIAALHGGHAWVEDRPGGGAAFKLRLPQRRTRDRHGPA